MVPVIFCIMLFTFAAIATKRFPSDSKVKEYIIFNRDKFTMLDKEAFGNMGGLSLKPVSIGWGYYKAITICKLAPLHYKIICWGDRDSPMWDICLDKKIDVNMPAKRKMDDGDKLDLSILWVLKDFKTKYE